MASFLYIKSNKPWDYEISIKPVYRIIPRQGMQKC
jgi:hypothetical protein